MQELTLRRGSINMKKEIGRQNDKYLSLISSFSLNVKKFISKVE